MEKEIKLIANLLNKKGLCGSWNNRIDLAKEIYALATKLKPESNIMDDCDDAKAEIALGDCKKPQLSAEEKGKDIEDLHITIPPKSSFKIRMVPLEKWEKIEKLLSELNSLRAGKE